MKNNSKFINYRIDIPKEFENVFSHFYIAANKSKESTTKTLLPSFRTMLVFSFGANILLKREHNPHIILDKCFILGPVKKAFEYSLPENSEIFVVNFKNDAFYRFFGPASLPKTLITTHPDQLLGENCFMDIWSDLKNEHDPIDRAKYILNLASVYLGRCTSLAEQLSNFNELITDPIKTIAEIHNKTERTIQIHHKKYFGYSAKKINRYQRFLRAINIIEKIIKNGSEIDWFNIIFDCGYYDQSHFIHDFKHFLNLSPTQYLKFQRDICNPVT